jgi:pimeloyl-ACP methyl ester carboxylesterase
LFDKSDLQSYLGYFFPLEGVRKCRTELESKADLKLYTTTIAMDDMDEVRAALGYEKMNLFGGSYGTRAALTYLKRYPQRVRAAILQGVAPPNQYMPGDFPVVMERALQGVLAACAADEACNTAFPNAEAIRYLLYNPVPATRVPATLHLAAQGNFIPLARTALWYRQNLVGSGSNGMYLSITCAEDLPWIKPGEGERLAANTFLGDYRLRQQREACALWPRADVERGYAEPVRADVPVLILTGEWDPVTPPANGDQIAKTLANSLHIVVPDGAHGLGGLEGMDCIDRTLTEFVARGTTKDIDTACVKSVRRKGFALKL